MPNHALCDGCGDRLPIAAAPGPPRRWCSGTCRSRYLRANETPEQKAARKTRQAKRAAVAKAARPWPRYDLVCVVCCEPFMSTRRGVLYCTKRCSRRAHGPNVKRRRRAQEALGERFLATDVFARDGWTCQLCRRVLDPARRWPDLGAATVDHIVPLSKDGPHTLANVQTACWRCNLDKGARETPNPLCGTPAGYRRHIREQEPTCAACKEANTAYKRTLRDRPSMAIRPRDGERPEPKE